MSGDLDSGFLQTKMGALAVVLRAYPTVTPALRKNLPRLPPFPDVF
jgi:hypothetical protein